MSVWIINVADFWSGSFSFHLAPKNPAFCCGGSVRFHRKSALAMNPTGWPDAVQETASNESVLLELKVSMGDKEDGENLQNCF